MKFRQPLSKPAFAGLLAVVLLFSAPVFSAGTVKKVMSLNLCADVLLLNLAEPGQIASLTFLAASSPLSPVKPMAAGLPINYGSAEEVLALNPDLVLVHRYSNIQLVQALEKLGFKVWKVDAPATIEEAATQIEALAEILGQAERGRQMADSLRSLPDLRAMEHGAAPVTAIYGPNGMTATPGALLHDLLERAGLSNFAAIHQLPANGRIPLEILLQQPPQALVLSGESHQRSDTLAQQTLQHPALRTLADRIPMTNIPSRYWSCGGPELTEAFSRLLTLRNSLFKTSELNHAL